MHTLAGHVPVAVVRANGLGAFVLVPRSLRLSGVLRLQYAVHVTQLHVFDLVNNYRLEANGTAATAQAT